MPTAGPSTSSAYRRRSGEPVNSSPTSPGSPPHQIAVIEPGPQDLEYDGQEYMVAVRSDPASGASVLSTTIQTAMLMQRALDPIEVSTSEGAIGQRLFAFTDDLDVTNRLFFDLRDAEGLGSFGRPEKPSLAALRAASGPDLQARRAGGQTWEPLERIGHRFDDQTHVRVGRTTSQDADVDRAANAIVATRIARGRVQRPPCRRRHPAQVPTRHRRIPAAQGPRRPDPRRCALGR